MNSVLFKMYAWIRQGSKVEQFVTDWLYPV